MKPEGRAIAVAELLRAGWTGKQVSEGLKVTDSGGSPQEALEAMKRAAPDANGELREATK